MQLRIVIHSPLHHGCQREVPAHVRIISPAAAQVFRQMNFSSIPVQLFSELEAEMHDVEGPLEMFHLEDTPLQWSAASLAASRAASHEASTHNSSAPSEAASHAAYDGWSGHPLGLRSGEAPAQHASSTRGIDVVSEGFQHRMHDSSANRRNSIDSNSSYGDMPTAIAEQVCPLSCAPFGICLLSILF